jgi:hypothetical protein
MPHDSGRLGPSCSARPSRGFHTGVEGCRGQGYGNHYYVASRAANNPANTVCVRRCCPAQIKKVPSRLNQTRRFSRGVSTTATVFRRLR